MNKETIIRVACVAIAVFAALICMFDVITFPFGGKVVIAICLLIFCTIATYFNNDFCDDDAIGTGITRQRKREKKPNYIGERFYIHNEEADNE